MGDLKARRIYKIISIIFLAICGYLFLLPVLSALMERIIPHFWTCPFLKITGAPCPFCGITRGFGSIYRLEAESVSVISLVGFLVVLAEAAFRIMMVLTISSMKDKTVEIIFFMDVIYHLFLTISVTMYVIMYLLNNF